MINYQNIIASLNALREELFQASLPEQSQIAADGIKAINGLLLKLEQERAVSKKLSDYCGSLCVTVGALGRELAQNTSELQDIRDQLQEMGANVISLDDIREQLD
jgi:uncharacterized phage infection (PIP) family protein YhgE